MWELLWARAEMGAFEKTALVAKHFTRGKIGAPPGRGVGGTTIVAFPPDTVCKLCGGIISIPDHIIGWGLVALRLVGRPEVLHGARGDRVGGWGVGIGRRVRLGVSGPIVVRRGWLVVETVSFRGGVTCLHYDLIWVRGWRIKVPRLLLLLLREMGRGGRL